MNIEATIEENAHHFLLGLKKEYDGDEDAASIIADYIQTGSITEANEQVLKIQLMDSLKILGIGIPFVLIPGASILMPILLRVAEKYHIQLLPSAFDT